MLVLWNVSDGVGGMVIPHECCCQTFVALNQVSNNHGGLNQDIVAAPGGGTSNLARLFSTGIFWVTFVQISDRSGEIPETVCKKT